MSVIKIYSMMASHFPTPPEGKSCPPHPRIDSISTHAIILAFRDYSRSLACKPHQPLGNLNRIPVRDRTCFLRPHILLRRQCLLIQITSRPEHHIFGQSITWCDWSRNSVSPLWPVQPNPCGMSATVRAYGSSYSCRCLRGLRVSPELQYKARVQVLS